MYGDNFFDSKGQSDVGALTKDGMRAEKLRKPALGEIEDFRAVPIQFYGQSTKAAQYPNYNKTMPTANKMEYGSFTTGFGRFYGTTAYQTQFTKDKGAT